MSPSLIDPRSAVPPRIANGVRPMTLTDDRLHTLRLMLEEQRTFRTEQLAELYRSEPVGPLGSTDVEIHDRLAAGARAALHAVEAALWRMDEGVYARCTACAGPVEPERLEILPQSAMCLPCHRGAALGR